MWPPNGSAKAQSIAPTSSLTCLERVNATPTTLRTADFFRGWGRRKFRVFRHSVVLDLTSVSTASSRRVVMRYAFTCNLAK